MHSDYLSPEDLAFPDAALSGAIQYLQNGDTHLPAWAIAALFLRSKEKERTRISIIDEAEVWVGRCRLGLIKFNGSPYDQEIPCVTMAGLDPNSEFTPKKNISRFDVLIEMKSTIEFGCLHFQEFEMKWLIAELAKIEKLKNTQNEENLAEDNETCKQSEALEISKVIEGTKGRRNKQIALITDIAGKLEYFDLQNIPEGGRKAIKAECLKNTTLFTVSGFDHAWDEANRRGVIRMQDKEKYLSNQ